MTKQELRQMGIDYDLNDKVVRHWSKPRGWCVLTRHVQNVGNNAYYVFKHNGKAVAIREETIIKAFKEE